MNKFASEAFDEDRAIKMLNACLWEMNSNKTADAFSLLASAAKDIALTIKAMKSEGY